MTPETRHINTFPAYQIYQVRLSFRRRLAILFGKPLWCVLTFTQKSDGSTNIATDHWLSLTEPKPEAQP